MSSLFRYAAWGKMPFFLCIRDVDRKLTASLNIMARCRTQLCLHRAALSRNSPRSSCILLSKWVSGYEGGDYTWWDAKSEERRSLYCNVLCYIEGLYPNYLLRTARENLRACSLQKDRTLRADVAVAKNDEVCSLVSRKRISDYNWAAVWNKLRDEPILKAFYLCELPAVRRILFVVCVQAEV